jgi:DNA methylase
MSWRIEESDALTLLRELPSGWAQTCVTRPPREVPVAELIVVLEEVRRVLRADGTLWLALSRGGNSQRILDRLAGETAWLRAERPKTPAPSSVALFTKQAAYLHNHRLLPTVPAGRRRYATHCPGSAGARAPRRAFCVPASSQDRLLSFEVIGWCILTSTVVHACGVCGTPWRPASASSGRGERWRRRCVHLNGRGRSLVIDPYCGRGSTGLVAQLRGRDFLGIEQSAALAALARRRLSMTETETVR